MLTSHFLPVAFHVTAYCSVLGYILMFAWFTDARRYARRCLRRVLGLTCLTASNVGYYTVNVALTIWPSTLPRSVRI